MVQLHMVSDQEQVVDTMIGLTHLTNLHRAIVAGSGSMEFYLALSRRSKPPSSNYPHSLAPAPPSLS